MTPTQQVPQDGLIRTQPAMTVGGSITLITLAINAVVSYGITITPDLRLLIVFLVGTLGPLIGGFITHNLVFSPATVSRLQAEWQMMVHAAQQTPPTPPTIVDQPPQI